jgi:hypothetical protein
LSLKQTLNNVGRCTSRKRHGSRGAQIGKRGASDHDKILPSCCIISVLIVNLPVPSQVQIAHDPGHRMGTLEPASLWAI